ncbi:MAG: hypothetical protein J6C46_04215 [Clostridia bacterium]|nr:hypothetical protein [Clostridia bacterium]
MAEQRTIGAIVKAYRNIYGVSIEEFCKKGQFSKSTISKLEALVFGLNHEKDEETQFSVAVNMCEKLANCMEMKLSELFTIVENIEQEKSVEFNVVVYLKLSEFLMKTR